MPVVLVEDLPGVPLAPLPTADELAFVPIACDSVDFCPLVGIPVDGRVGSTDERAPVDPVAPAPGPDDDPGPAAAESPMPPPCAIAAATGATASAAATPMRATIQHTPSSLRRVPVRVGASALCADGPTRIVGGHLRNVRCVVPLSAVSAVT